MSTLKEIRDDVKADLDLEDELFISDADVDRWINEGITTAEQTIHTLYEDYFLSQTEIPIVTGTNTYAYPADIYANKIRKIVFRENNSNSTSMHWVRRVKDLLRASERDHYTTGTNPTLQWSPINDASNGRLIRIFPKIARGGILDVWYIRNAKKLVADTDECDIDEFEKYVKQYAKTQALLKDHDPLADDSRVLEEKYAVDMINTLSDMSPDRDDEVIMDTTHYDDMVGGDIYGDY